MAENTKEKALEIVIDDGSKRVPIRNLSGDEIGEFYFRPTDVDIINRFNESVSKFDEIVAPLEEIDIQEDGSADENDPAAVKAMNEAKTRLFEMVDYIFGGNMSEAFFGKMHPFSPVGGVFYCESALEKVGSFITAQFEQETAKVQKRIGKYTKKYAGKGGKK